MNSLRVKRTVVVLGALVLASICFYIVAPGPSQQQGRGTPWKLYWFVPDGLRADPEVFDIYRWAREGKLPHIRRMMQEGSYGYSIPVFPSHTPVNFATLFTGVSPKRHGVADGPIRVQGYPLKVVSHTGFSSVAKTIDPLWYTLEQAGKIVSLLSIPGSTPPEITTGNVVKGRWGGWGVEFPNLIFHSDHDAEFRDLLGWNDKVFQFGKKLTDFVKAGDPSGWQVPLPKSFSPLRELNLRNWERDLYVLIADGSDDGQVNYDLAYFSIDKRSFLFDLAPGQWSPWFPLDLEYRLSRNYQENMPQRLELEQDLSKLTFSAQARVKVIKLGAADFFRIRVLYDGLNESVVVPQTLSTDLHEAAGPMVDFVDNFPPQLVYFKEDKQTFLEESEMSFAWHRKAQKYFFDKVDQDVFVQSVYSPNQMLTSRWWMGAVDPLSKAYAGTSIQDRETAMSEVLGMYKHIDDMIGEALLRRSPESYVVLSSDHGVVPLDYEVKLNNLFAKKGWLKFFADKTSGTLQIDWARSKVVFLNMNHIFLKPEGLGGDYRPSKGPEYTKLRNSVVQVLRELRDDQGESPLAEVHTREDAGKWGLPGERIGDLVIANRAGYGWIEDVTKDMAVFSTALKSGYKQAVLPDQNKGLWTPFMMVGPGVKAGHELSRPIQHIEQYPTVLKLLGVKPTFEPDAKPLAEIFTDVNEATQ
jgi:predicted AlkP superfamily phosphohydrolase/phosphomutase